MADLTGTFGGDGFHASVATVPSMPTPNFEAAYTTLGHNGQARLYTRYGGGTLLKRPEINPLTGMHEGDNLGFSLYLSDSGKMLWKDFRSDSHGDLFDFLEALLGKEAAFREMGLDASPLPPTPKPFQPTAVPDPVKQQEKAKAIYEASIDDPGDIRAYLKRREIIQSLPEDIFFHAAQRAMIAPVRDVDGEITGIHRTWLASGEKGMLGPMMGGTVRLMAPVGAQLGLGEGLETVLSVLQAVDMPCWATLSTSGLKNVQLPDTLCDITLFADSDQNGAGQKAARQLAQRLIKEGRSVQIVWPCDQNGDPKSLDFNDLLKADPSGQSIRDRLELAEKIVEETSPSNPSRLRAISITELLTMTFPPRTLLLDPWLPSQGIAMIYALRGIGKTYFALEVAYAAACGTSFLAWQAPKPQGVLYLDGEMPGSAIQERISKIVAVHEKQPQAVFKLLTPDLQDNGMPDLTTPDGRMHINQLIDDTIDLVVVDNISTLCRCGKENESESWLPVQEWALKLRAKGKSVLLVHHAGKGGQQRGTSRREDVLDTVIALRRPTDYHAEQGARFEVHFEKARSIHGDHVKPLEVQLQSDGSWGWKTVENSTFDRVVALKKEGLSQMDIAQTLNVHKSQISRHLKKANELGLTVLEGGNKKPSTS